MSHFSKVKTQLMEQVYLLDALRDLGFEPVVAEPGTALNVQGYGGRQAQAEVKIASGYGHYEIGFVRAADGSYEAIADWSVLDYAMSTSQAQFLTDLHQRYAYHTTLVQLQAQGFTLLEEQNEDGDLVLTMVG